MKKNPFPFEDCLLKHYIRHEQWLPHCRYRNKIVKSSSTKKTERRLRYFTFCATGAIDVLMLDVAKIIKPNIKEKFDNVVFFDYSQDDIDETQKNVPGAIGFPGDFFRIVLYNDPNEENYIDNAVHLEAPENDIDDRQIRSTQVLLDLRQNFIQRFPFDIINLDFETFVFKPSQPIPGTVINALRKILTWQQRPFRIGSQGQDKYLDGFTFMFTTQVGPPSLGNNYLSNLENTIEKNINANSELVRVLEKRTGFKDVNALRTNKFDLFFKLGLPKVLADLIWDTDWYIDPEFGFSIFEFERSSESGPYKMLHIIIEVKRQNPSIVNRMPGESSSVAEKAYTNVIRHLFETKEGIILDSRINKNTLQANLDLIKSRRKRYRSEE